MMMPRELMARATFCAVALNTSGLGQEARPIFAFHVDVTLTIGIDVIN